jgi:hypothetical protein
VNFDQYLKENYSSDSDKWYDDVVDLVEKGDLSPDLSALAKDLKSHKYAPNHRTMDVIEKILAKCKDTPKSLNDFVENLEKGKYDKEFMNHERAIKTFMDELSQALNYN